MPIKWYSLLREPWIRVLTHNGEQQAVSMLELFRGAHTFRGLAGEMPPQDAAILRLLLAVLYVIVTRQTIDGAEIPIQEEATAIDRWESYWLHGAFPPAAIERYLLSHEERFYLFHELCPFYQVPFSQDVLEIGGTKYKPTVKPLGALIGELAESGNKPRLFPARLNKEQLSYDEAARWLVYLNSFDVAPAGAPGKAETGISIKGYGTGWLGRLGLTWLTGSNLFETLMLNLTLNQPGADWGSCTPEWEQPLPAKEDLLTLDPPFPKDICALYTMQFRRVHLLRDEQQKCVYGYLLWSGQALDTKDALMEPMTVRRRGKDALVPKLHDPSRQLWRDFPALVSKAEEQDARPGVLQWMDTLMSLNVLPRFFLRLHTAGIGYTNNTAVDHVFWDSLDIHSHLLGSMGMAWSTHILYALKQTNELVLQLVQLTRSLEKAAGGEDNARKAQQVIEGAFFMLDEPFRRWLAGVDAARQVPEQACADWIVQARVLVRRRGEELVKLAGPTAHAGRWVKEDARSVTSLDKQVEVSIETGLPINWRPKGPGENARSRLYTAADAYNRFLMKTAAK